MWLHVNSRAWLLVASTWSTKIPCLAKGISAGLWVDLEAAWAFAFGRGVTCKRSWDYVGGPRRDFMVGCLRAAAAVSGSMVLEDRWILPHLFVRTLSIHGGFLGFLSWFLLMLVSFRGPVPDWGLVFCRGSFVSRTVRLGGFTCSAAWSGWWCLGA